MPRPKILLLDDNGDFLKIATEFLELNGYEVVPTSDLTEGRRLLEEEPFAVAFLDINFDVKDDHDKSGLALAKDTIGTTSVPKVIMTVHGRADYVRESLLPRLGKGGAAVDFLHKEDGLQQMVDSIERIIKHTRVFLSYADPDRARVEELYNKLQGSGFFPWMDKMDLDGGENWEATVSSAMRKTDFVVVCLSTVSVEYSGFFQTEIRLALRMLEEQPPGKMFLIPVRLEECEHPSLGSLHRVDLFKPDGYDKLVRALRRN